MSIRIMTLVWDMPNTGHISRTDRDVLLKLADNANEAGECFPSTTNIAAKTWMDRATVFRCLKKLESVNFIRRNKSKNQKTNHYTILISNIKTITKGSQPATVALCDGSHQITSKGSQPATGGVAQCDTEPSYNHHTINHHKEKNTKKEKMQKPADVDDQVWDDFLVHRKTMKAPLTPTALRGIENQAKLAGLSLQDALAECCARGWRGFKAEWYKRDQVNKSIMPLVAHQSVFKGGAAKNIGQPTLTKDQVVCMVKLSPNDPIVMKKAESALRELRTRATALHEKNDLQSMINAVHDQYCNLTGESPF